MWLLLYLTCLRKSVCVIESSCRSLIVTIVWLYHNVLFTLLLVAIWVVSSLVLCWIGLLWAFLCMSFDSYVNEFFLHCKLFIKTQNNGQWKTSSFFFFFLLFGGSRAGYGRVVTNGDSLGGKLSPYLRVGFLAYSGWKCLAFKPTAARFSKVGSSVLTRRGHCW